MTFKIRQDPQRLGEWSGFLLLFKAGFSSDCGPARVVNLTDSEPSGYKNPCVNYSPGNFKGTKLLFWYHSVRWTNDPRVETLQTLPKVERENFEKLRNAENSHPFYFCRTTKYLKGASTTRNCAIGGFFVSIPLFLAGTVNHWLHNYPNPFGGRASQ